MSLAEIEAELDRLAPDELRRLALKSWSAFVRREGRADGPAACDETDPRLLGALDEALAAADTTAGQGHTAQQVRKQLGEWTSR